VNELTRELNSFELTRPQHCWHVTRTMQHDWPASCCLLVVQENVTNMRQIFHASFWYEFLERVSPELLDRYFHQPLDLVS